MICPGCHYIDDRMPNCTVCGGRGWLGEEKADTDCTDSTDEKKEVKVKTFAERLGDFKAHFPGLVAQNYDGRRVVLGEAQKELRDVFALQCACAGLADVTTVQRTLVWAVVCMCLRRKSGLFRGEEAANKQTVAQWLSPVLTLLAKKNASYGNTALAPIRCFAKGRALDMLACRIDDKISRILTAQDAFGEDALADLAGYLVLAYLAMEDEWDAAVRAGTYCPTHRMRWNRCGCVPSASFAPLREKEGSREGAKDAKDEEYRDLDSSCGE